MKLLFSSILIIGLGAGALLYIRSSTPVAKAPAPLQPVAAAPTRSVPEGQREYRSASYHFSLIYPATLSAHEYTEANEAQTITFEGSDDTHAFQIYVVPYDGTTVDEARFKLDEPSGVRKEPTDIVVGGTKATMFLGNNPIMGDTREVWFIHDGYLYEVSTYKDFDAWLSGIMATWQFI